MDKVFLRLKMGSLYIKDLGLMVQDMGLEVIFIQMDPNIKEIGCTTINKAKEFIQIV